MWDHVRKLFAATQEAKVRGYLPGRFSFNVTGGRCEACAGDGTIKIEMHFLPDVYVPCEVCKGKRYNRDTLDITFKDKNVSDVLDLSCEEALEFFGNQPAIARHMQTLVDVGLGYVRLGQPATTLSGGEAQRVKLASELAKRSTGHTIYILDEPTTGLHFEDIRKLLTVLSPARRPGQHGAGDRAQPRRDQDGRLDHRPRPGGRRRRRHGGRARARPRTWPRRARARPASSWPGSCPRVTLARCRSPRGRSSSPRLRRQVMSSIRSQGATLARCGVVVGSTAIRLTHPAVDQVLEHPGQVGASMRNIVEQGQISGSSETTVLSGCLGVEPLHQVDLGADGDRRAGGRLVDRLDDVVGRADLVGELAHVVAALGVRDHDPVRVLGPERLDVLGRKRWWTEQWPFHSRNVASLHSASVEAAQVEPGVPHPHVVEVVAHREAGVAAEVLVGEEQDLVALPVAPRSAARSPCRAPSRARRGRWSTCRRRRRGRPRTPSARPTSSCR